MSRIFVCYRPQDSDVAAHSLYDRLVVEFGAVSILMNVPDLEPDQDRVKVWQRIIPACNVFLTVIGSRWLTFPGSGKQFLVDPADPIRVQLAIALENGVYVVPVLVDGGTLPPTSSLPENIARLTRRDPVEIGAANIENDTIRLIKMLQELPIRKNQANPWSRQSIRGKDVELHREITQEEAQQGCQRGITINRVKTAFAIPGGVTTGTRIRVRGAGTQGYAGGQDGDLFLTILVKSPQTQE